MFGNLSTSIAAVMTVLIGMFLLGLFIALGTWVLSWTNHVKKDLVVNVYFCTTLKCEKEATPKQIDAVRAQLASDPRIESFSFISKNDALAEMKKKYPELTENLARNPLPAAYEVIPRRAEDVKAIASGLDPPPVGVQEVKYGEKKAERILQVAKIVGGIFLVGSVILLIASTVLIGNTIRLSIFSRRREIEVMKLVGATNWFVRGPFMLEGLLCGLAGAIGAIILLILGKAVVLPSLLHGPLNAGSDVKALAFELNALVIIGVGLALGAAGSGLTIRRFLKI
jgi:cell division transport system permease protein